MRKASRCVVYSWFDIQEQTAHTSSIRRWEEKPPVGATESLSGMLFVPSTVTAELVSDVVFITCRQKSFVDPSKLEMRFWHHINAK